MLENLVNRLFERLGDGPPAVTDGEHVGLEASTAATRANERHVREKLHFDRLGSFARARFAATPRYVERKMRRSEITSARVGLGGEPAPEHVPGLGVRRGVASRRATEGRLIDQRDLGERASALDAVVLAGRIDVARALHARDGAVDDVVRERALAGSARPGDRAHDPQRNANVDALQVVRASVLDRQPRRRSAHRSRSNPQRVKGCERETGRQVGTGKERVGGPVEHQLAARCAGPGAELEHAGCAAHDQRVVLDDEHRVAPLCELAHRIDERRHVGRVKPHRRLVDDEERSGERAPEGRGERHPLRFSPRQRARGPIERQVAEPHALEVAEARRELLAHEIALRGPHRQRLESPVRVAELERVPRREIEPSHAVAEGRVVEAFAAARRTRVVRSKPREEHPNVHLVRARLEPLKPCAKAGVLASLPSAFTVDHQLALLLGEIAPRRAQRNR